MDLIYRNTEEKDKKIICEWKYDAEYSIYNLEPYEKQKQMKWGFCNPKRQKNYYSIFDGELLVAFINLTEQENEIFLGVGVNPKFLNRGYGKKAIFIADEISKKRYPNKSLYLEVRTFNKRAINCYKSAGFEIDGKAFIQTTHIGEGEFFRMVKYK